MSEALVLSAQQGAVRTLTLNRPAALNSFTTDMHRALRAALDEAAADAAVRCVVITGAGRGFCAGQDLSDPAIAPDLTPGATPKDIGRLLDDHYIPLAKRLRSMPVPVIAAVNGVAAGAGANMAFNCDLVVAAKSASFIQAFSKIGLIPDCGGTWLLPRLVGRARAIGLAMTGDKLPAEEAARIGLIWQVVDDAAFADTVGALAQRLAGMPTKALAETRRAMDAAVELGFDDGLALEARVQGELGRAHDYLEGASAFLQKRAPQYKDR
ncbi:enoyl-CoA hydratase-related protein [Caldimonas sp. KR1-144]|uniref:enoyl-CoA hydratase-related protein n=1 Tax=Caldimonas sp. KR1-144 TaxID=3400911 RepID=UPI003C1041D5